MILYYYKNIIYISKEIIFKKLLQKSNSLYFFLKVFFLYQFFLRIFSQCILLHKKWRRKKTIKND